jgi:hypothetical protein
LTQNPVSDKSGVSPREPIKRKTKKTFLLTQIGLSDISSASPRERGKRKEKKKISLDKKKKMS